MVTSTQNRVRPPGSADPETDRTSWNKPNLTPRAQDEDSQPTSNFVYAILALAVIVGAYLLYSYQWPTTTSGTTPITKTDVVPPVAAPDQAPAASTTVAPLPDAPAATPKAANPPATGTATPPATTTTP